MDNRPFTQAWLMEIKNELYACSLSILYVEAQSLICNIL